MLTGSLFWGCLFAGVIVGGLIGAVAFFFLWQGSIYFVQRAVAIIIGIVIIAVIRVGIMFYGRMRYFQSFYRKKPAAANFYFLAMEWANFAVRNVDGAIMVLKTCFKLISHGIGFVCSNSLRLVLSLSVSSSCSLWQVCR